MLVSVYSIVLTLGFDPWFCIINLIPSSILTFPSIMAPTSSNQNAPYGRRLMPVVLDDVAANDPTRVFAAIPKSANISDGFRDVSYSEVANSTNKMARWFRETFGTTST